MLAILDPELRHSSPTRRQSATLIGSLALISIVVGAAAPSPRTAEAAPSPMSENVAASPASRTDLQLLSSQEIPEAKGYPDSREIIGGASKHEKTDVMTKTEVVTSQLQRTITSAATQAIQSSATIIPSAILQALGQGIGKAAAKDSDERPALLARVLATDTSASLRRIAAWGLSEYADRQVAAEALANALRRDADPSVREMAAWSLSNTERSSTAVEALSAALRSDANTRVRATAAWALGSVGDRSSADALAAALSDASVEVRKRAAWALGNSDLKQAPRQLIALLSDKDPEMRELAAWSLFQIEDPTSIPALETALARETNKELQIDYIRALAAVGEKSVEALKNLLESKDPEIRTIAVKALAGGHATGPWPRPWPEPRPFPQ